MMLTVATHVSQFFWHKIVSVRWTTISLIVQSRYLDTVPQDTWLRAWAAQVCRYDGQITAGLTGMRRMFCNRKFDLQWWLLSKMRDDCFADISRRLGLSRFCEREGRWVTLCIAGMKTAGRFMTNVIPERLPTASVSRPRAHTPVSHAPWLLHFRFQLRWHLVHRHIVQFTM